MLSIEKQNDFDPNFWAELDSLEKCYYIGFLIADGYITSSSNSLGVDLAVKDITWLNNYKENLDINTKIILRDLRPKYNAISASVRKQNKQWAKDLKKYGMIPRKTGKESLPFDFCTSKKEVAAMFLGYSDADNSFYREKTGKYRFATYGSTKICQQLNDVLHEYVGIEPNKVHLSNNLCDFIYSSKYSAKKDMINLYNFLYSQNPELNTCCLERKHNKWASFMLGTFGVAA